MDKIDNIENLINKVHNCDCLELLKKIPDKSVDMILQDPPYNKTYCKWDINIFDKIDEYWAEWKRIAKKTAPILFSATQPFTSKLVMSNLKNFKYEWIWDKHFPRGFMNAKKMPMNKHENIIVFGYGKIKYYPQMINLDKPRKYKNYSKRKDTVYNINNSNTGEVYISNKKYPNTILLDFWENNKGKFHPTQKPLSLFKYLIQTYTQPGDIVFDGFAGSFTTAVAAESLGRNWICCELLKEYCDVGQKRIDELRVSMKDDGV